jgi:hypothetical protein
LVGGCRVVGVVVAMMMVVMGRDIVLSIDIQQKRKGVT